MGWFWAAEADPVRVHKPDSTCPIRHSSVQQCPHQPSGKPPQGSDRANRINPLNNMPFGILNRRSPGQNGPLSTERVRSTIPKGQTCTEEVWEYPSAQQMYNTMINRGKGPVPEDAVEEMVAVHNFLNEGAWQEILKWELPHTRLSHRDPRLLKFMGRPDAMSPRASFLQALGRVYPSKFGFPPPFDRHDWTVLRSTPDGDKWQQVRYVIDYYAGPDDLEGSPTFILDVRPALDSLGAARDRLAKVFEGSWSQ